MHTILFGVAMIAAASVLAGSDAMAQSTQRTAKAGGPAGLEARTAIPLPNPTLLAAPVEFNCEFKAASSDEALGQSSPGLPPAQTDPDAVLRAKLDYERQCHAEMILRDRLLELQAAVGETVKALSRSDPPAAKRPKGLMADEVPEKTVKALSRSDPPAAKRPKGLIMADEVPERVSQASTETRNDLQCNFAVCARFYRSFNRSDCTYRPYGGGARKTCDR
jgi:BA14K-like protein